MAEFHYTALPNPEGFLAVRLPGIYADDANTKNVIVDSDYANEQLTRATGFTAAFGGSTAHSKTLASTTGFTSLLSNVSEILYLSSC